MSQRARFSTYTSIQKTTTYDAAHPAASPASWGTDHTQDAFNVVNTGTVAMGAVVLFTAAPALFAGVRVKLQPSYTTGQTPELELWTYDGVTWTQRLTVALDTVTNPNGGCDSGQTRVLELFLATPLAGVTGVWVTQDPHSAAAPTFLPLHFYAQVENTDTADPFDAATGSPEFTALRPRGSKPADILGGIFAPFAYTSDLTPDPDDDDPAANAGAWELWDLPVSVALDFADEAGNDVVLVAIDDQLYVLDWERYRDEWQWDAYAPIYTKTETVRIPSAPQVSANGYPAATAAGDYAPDQVKRLREFLFELADDPTDAMSKVRVTVAETDVPTTTRTGLWVTARRNRCQISVSGMSFTVILEHAANELFRPLWWQVTYDVRGPQIASSRIAS